MDNKRIDEIIAEIKAMLDQWEQEARKIYWPEGSKNDKDKHLDRN